MVIKCAIDRFMESTANISQSCSKSTLTELMYPKNREDKSMADEMLIGYPIESHFPKKNIWIIGNP
jgi:hypothetical protein